jgi:hypothetical protein
MLYKRLVGSRAYLGAVAMKKICRLQESNPERYWLMDPGFCADVIESD